MEDSKTILSAAHEMTFLNAAVREAIKREPFERASLEVSHSPQHFVDKVSTERFACIIFDSGFVRKVGAEVCRDLVKSKVTSPTLIFLSEESETKLWSGFDAGVVSIQHHSVATSGFLGHAIINCMQSFELRLKQQNALDSNAITSRQLGLLAHELRAPLEMLRFAQQALLASNLDQSAQQIAVNAERTVSYMCEYVSNFLESARLESGQVKINKEHFCFSALVEEVIDLLWAQANIKNVLLMFSPRFDKQKLFFGDKLRLRQVLINIIGNAVRYTDAGIVSVVAQINNGRLEIVVRDTGIGMSEERAREVFHSQQSRIRSLSGDAHSGGLGIGVRLCRKLVSAMGGEMAVNSKYGLGTVVKILLPLEVDEKWAPTSPKCDNFNELVT